MAGSTEGFVGGGQTPSLATLQSRLSTQRARPPPVHNVIEHVEPSRIPLRQPLQNRESKGGLRRMFTRNRAEKADKAASMPVLESLAPVLDVPGNGMRSESKIPRSITNRAPNSRAPSPAATPQKAKPSRMNLRSRTIRQAKPAPKSPKSTKPSTKTLPKPPPRSSATWDPPPLSQAYPQAIKYAQLSATTLSADSILRISNHKRSNSVRDDFAQKKSDDAAEEGTNAKTGEKPKTKHKRKISGSVSRAEWTQKIYVLVTSGYLLQYTGTGSFDRLPEKMLQLGKDSVAFASDIIPGKHWVLQISQAMDSDGTPAPDSRSFLARLTFRGADHRRSATSLLLILESAQEMETWLAVIRREVEALGGKKHVSETGKPSPDNKVMELKTRPSHRFTMQKSEHSPNAEPPHKISYGPPTWVKEKNNELQQELEAAAEQLTRTQSIRPSTGLRSDTNSIASHDGNQLENLRDSQHRYSYMSSGQRTLITSQASSPSASPSREGSEDVSGKNSAEEARLRPNATAINERRRSMQSICKPVFAAGDGPAKKHRHSTYDGPVSPSTLLPAPNFSIPNPSSKRYSTIKSPVTCDAPSAPSSLPRFQKSSRKSPPISLNATRSLSPVLDSNSPRRDSYLTTADIDALSLGPIGPGAANDNERNPVDSRFPEIAGAQPDFQFPRKVASMQLLGDESSTYFQDISRTAPTAPLPPIPRQKLNRNDSNDESATSLDDDPNLSPNLATPPPLTKKKSRPQSVSTSPPVSSSSRFPQRPFSADENTAESKIPVFAALQRVKDADLKSLANRRSMPVLLNGPPPVPPPKCALPPIPPPNAERRMSQASKISRGSRISQTSVKSR